MTNRLINEIFTSLDITSSQDPVCSWKEILQEILKEDCIHTYQNWYLGLRRNAKISLKILFYKSHNMLNELCLIITRIIHYPSSNVTHAYAGNSVFWCKNYFTTGSKEAISTSKRPHFCIDYMTFFLKVYISNHHVSMRD